MYSKTKIFDFSIEIVKEYARGGGEHPAGELERVYDKLKKMNVELEGEDSGPLVM
jgi:hypothetical protein